MIYALLLFVSTALFSWLAWMRFSTALLVFIALLPAYLMRFSLGPFPTTLLEVFLVILLCVWVISWASGRGGLGKKRILTLPNLPTCLLFAFFITLSLTSILVVPRAYLFDALGLWKAYLLEPLLFGVMLFFVWKKHEDRVRTLVALALSGALVGAIGLVQWLTGLGIPAPWDIEGRITSIYPFPNAVGLFLAPLVSALIVFGVTTWRTRMRHEKMFLGGALGLMLLGIILAQTEAALIAIPASLVLAYLISPQSSRLNKIACVALAGIALAAAFSLTPVREKLLLQDFSGNVRRSQWSETVQLVRDHPLFGAGLGYYPELMRTYHTAWQYEIFQYPHNILLNTWVELGVLGVGGGVLGILFLAKKIWERKNDPLVLTGATALCTMCIHGLVDVPFFKNDLAFLTVIFIVFLLIPSVPRLRNSSAVRVR